MVSEFARLGRVPSASLLTAAVWGLGLVIAGFVVPVYGSESRSAAGELTEGTATFVGVNGPGIVLVLALPLLVTVLVGCALLLSRLPGALPVAWALTALLAAFNLMAMLTIGLFVVPLTAALVVACASAPGSKTGTAASV